MADVVAVARHGRTVEVAPGRPPHGSARAVVERIVAEEASVYGVTTGFGALASVRCLRPGPTGSSFAWCSATPPAWGTWCEPEVVRAMMLLRARTLAAGSRAPGPSWSRARRSALGRPDPAVPELGSLGASGDLAPLAHVGSCS